MYDRQTRTEANIHPNIHARTSYREGYHLGQRTFSPVSDTYPALSYIYALLTTAVESGMSNETRLLSLATAAASKGTQDVLQRLSPGLCVALWCIGVGRWRSILRVLPLLLLIPVLYLSLWWCRYLHWRLHVLLRLRLRLRRRCLSLWSLRSLLAHGNNLQPLRPSSPVGLLTRLCRCGWLLGILCWACIGCCSGRWWRWRIGCCCWRHWL